MLHITADLRNLGAIRDFVEQYATASGMSPSDVYGVVLAVDEAVTNICAHGYQGQPGSIELSVEQDEQDLILRIRDDAPPFDPTTVSPPSLSGTIEERALGGMGIHFMRHYTDEVTHRAFSSRGNELTLKKRIQGERKP